MRLRQEGNLHAHTSLWALSGPLRSQSLSKAQNTRRPLTDKGAVVRPHQEEVASILPVLVRHMDARALERGLHAEPRLRDWSLWFWAL